MNDYWNDPALVTPLAERRRSRFWLFAPFILLIVVIAAYSAYWIYARAEIELGVDEWVASERARGAIVDFESAIRSASNLMWPRRATSRPMRRVGKANACNW